MVRVVGWGALNVLGHQSTCCKLSNGLVCLKRICSSRYFVSSMLLPRRGYCGESLEELILAIATHHSNVSKIVESQSSAPTIFCVINCSVMLHIPVWMHKRTIRSFLVSPGAWAKFPQRSQKTKYFGCFWCNFRHKLTTNNVNCGSDP